MRTIRRRMALFVCIIALILTFLPGKTLASGTDLDQMIEETTSGLSSMRSKPGRLLKDPEALHVGTTDDWIPLVLAFGGSREYYDEYLGMLRTHVESRYAEYGCLEDIKATEYHRIALAVMALGGDPTSFGTRPDGSPIDLIADGTYDFGGIDLGLQGLNGLTWALIVLDASGVEIPTDARYQRQDIIDAILSAQEPDGGFGLMKGGSEVDITAMTLQALSPYKEQYSEPIEKALLYLSSVKTGTCGYISYGEENAESVSQVIMALCALGIDPETDPRFCSGGMTTLAELERFRFPDGTYGHALTSEKGDSMATVQALEALLSLRGLRDGTGYVFSFRELPALQQRKDISITAVIIAAAAAAGAAGCVITIRKRKKHGTVNRSDSV